VFLRQIGPPAVSPSTNQNGGRVRTAGRRAAAGEDAEAVQAGRRPPGRRLQLPHLRGRLWVTSTPAPQSTFICEKFTCRCTSTFPCTVTLIPRLPSQAIRSSRCIRARSSTGSEVKSFRPASVTQSDSWRSSPSEGIFTK